jgi:hypothetical protein
LLLLVENFCKQDEHDARDLNVMKDGLLVIMEEIKNILNRTEGCKMRIIKFHLIAHYIDDIKRFGSMKNSDSSIGERHHCTEVKQPAKNTQRRKLIFEQQTANRYIENLAISLAMSDMDSLSDDQSKHSSNVERPNMQAKRCNILYEHKQKQLFKRNSNDNKLRAVVWKDVQFQEQLTEFCSNLVENGNVDSPIQFCTQHNRMDLIFRGDPEWIDQYPWYDWAFVDWNLDECIPAKIMLFMNLEDNLLIPFGNEQMGYVSEKGYYAISHSFPHATNKLPHEVSLLSEYGVLMTSTANCALLQLCLFSVDSINKPCVAVPYQVAESIMNAKEWLVLKSRETWNKILTQHMATELSKIDMVALRNNSQNVL